MNVNEILCSMQSSPKICSKVRGTPSGVSKNLFLSWRGNSAAILLFGVPQGFASRTRFRTLEDGREIAQSEELAVTCTKPRMRAVCSMPPRPPIPLGSVSWCLTCLGRVEKLTCPSGGHHKSCADRIIFKLSSRYPVEVECLTRMGLIEAVTFFTIFTIYTRERAQPNVIIWPCIEKFRSISFYYYFRILLQWSVAEANWISVWIEPREAVPICGTRTLSFRTSLVTDPGGIGKLGWHRT